MVPSGRFLDSLLTILGPVSDDCILTKDRIRYSGETVELRPGQLHVNDLADNSNVDEGLARRLIVLM